MLSGLDLLPIIIYFTLILFVGFLSGRKETKNGFLIADRKLGTFSGLATILSSKIGAGLLISYVAFVYAFGISALWLFVGFSLGYLIFYLFIIKLKKHSDVENYYTMSDYFFDKYGKTSGYLTASISFVNYFLLFTIQLIAGAKILSILTGFSYFISLLIVTSTIVLYLFVGGFKAVVKTDIIQYLAIFILFVVILLFLLPRFQFEPSQWNVLATGKKNLLSFLIGGILYPFASAELWQRVYALKDIKTVKKTLFLSAVFYPLIGFVIAMIGMIVKLKLANVDPDVALVHGFSALLPSGLIGLSVVAVFAAVMSSADTHLYTSVSFFIQNIILGKESSKEKTIRFIRLCLILFAIGAFLLSLYLKSLVEATLIFSGVIILLSTIVLTTWIHQRVSHLSLNLGLIFGLLFMVIYVYIGKIEPTIVMVAIGGTFLGLLVGGLIRFLSGKAKRA